LAAQTFDERYRHWAPRSGELFTEASRYIPGGAGSSARTVKFGWKPYPPFMAEGYGPRLRDVDGHEYVDYLLGLGPMILGHRHPVVTQAVTSAVTDLGNLQTFLQSCQAGGLDARVCLWHRRCASDGSPCRRTTAGPWCGWSARESCSVP